MFRDDAVEHDAGVCDSRGHEVDEHDEDGYWRAPSCSPC